MFALLLILLGFSLIQYKISNLILFLYHFENKFCFTSFIVLSMFYLPNEQWYIDFFPINMMVVLFYTMIAVFVTPEYLQIVQITPFLSGSSGWGVITVPLTTRSITPVISASSTRYLQQYCYMFSNLDSLQFYAVLEIFRPFHGGATSIIATVWYGCSW